MRKYRTTINLQFETLKHFVLDWHEKEEEQRYVVNAVKAVDNEIELTEMQIEKERDEEMVSCKDDDTTKPDTYMSISEKFMQGEISETT